MFCGNCGRPINDGKRFCGSCGATVTNIVVEQTASSVQEEAIDSVETFDQTKKVITDSQLNLDQDATKQKAEIIRPEVMTGSASISAQLESSNKKFTWLIASAISVLIILAAVGIWAYSQGYIMDNQSPQVMITSPASDQTLYLTSENRVQEIIEIKATDNRVIKKVDIYINDAVVKEFNKGDRYSYNWTTDLAGNYNIKVVAYDNKGNEGTSKLVKINVLRSSSADNSSNNNFSNSSSSSQDNEQMKIEAAIINHYKNIPSNLTLAHSYFSNKLQQQLPLENWGKDFSSTISDSVDNVNVTIINGNESTASFSMTSRDTSSGGKTLVRKWAGQWKLVLENGQWKLNEPQINMVSENYE